MHTNEMKYGFLTTYEYTIFVRQDEVNGEPRLHYSNPISHKATPGVKSVSIRECMFYLMYITANGDFQFKNKFPLDEWVAKEKTLEALQPGTPYQSPSRGYSDMIATQRGIELPNIGGLSLQGDDPATQPVRVKTDYIGNYIEINGRKIYIELPGESANQKLPIPTSPTPRPPQRGSESRGAFRKPSFPGTNISSQNQDLRYSTRTQSRKGKAPEEDDSKRGKK